MADRFEGSPGRNNATIQERRITQKYNVPLPVNPGGDWPGEDSYGIPGSSSMMEEEGMEVGGQEGAHPARRKRKNSTTHI